MNRFTICVLAIFLSLFAVAQTDGGRTVKTKVADALAKLPSDNKAENAKYLKDIASTGQEGVMMLAEMMKSNPTNDHTTVEYAINGLSFLVMQKGNEQYRLEVEKAYCAALDYVIEPEQKVFFIRQLQSICGKEAVPTLSKYLSDPYLGAFAARAIVQSASEEGKQALRTALPQSSGTNQLAIVQAIGDMHDEKAESLILALAKATPQENEALKKICHFGLGRVGSKLSLPYLAAEAVKVNYASDKTFATDGYIRLLKRMTEIGQVNEAELEATKLLNTVSSATLPHIKSSALFVLYMARKEKAEPLVLNAMRDGNSEYRAAALNMFKPYANSQFVGKLAAMLPTVSEGVKKDIVIFLGSTGSESVLGSIIPFMKSNDKSLRNEAIAAVTAIGGDEAIKALLELLKSTDSDEIALIKNSLLVVKGDLSSGIMRAARQSSPAGMVAIIEVIGQRALGDYNSTLFALAQGQNAELKRAALGSLKNVVWEKDLTTLCQLLESSKVEDYDALQTSLISALGERSTARKVAIITERLHTLPQEKQYAYLGALAKLGNVSTLSILKDGFDNGTQVQKEIAFTALTNWNGIDAAYDLYDICKAEPTYRDRGFKAYVSLIARSRVTPEQKVLMMRKLMDVATTVDEKKTVLREIGRQGTFGALLFAGKYMDDADLRLDAARIVRSAINADKTLSGKEFKELFQKANTLLAASDDDYQKQEAQLRLEQMNDEGGFVTLFNGKDLSGWKGLVADPIRRSKMTDAELSAAQKKADDLMRTGWTAKDGLLVFNGHGDNLCTEKKYGDFEMYVDWMITKDGDAGIYLRGTPQVQIWDTARYDVGAQVGSGGLYNNQKHRSTPLALADNKIGEWNTFRITMKGERVTVYLNGVLVVDNVPLENYWDRKLPIFEEEQIELQAHGTHVAYRDIYINELPRPKRFELSDEEKAEGFKVLFDGVNMNEWVGNLEGYVPEDGIMQVYPNRGRGNLYTKDEYADFVFRFEFNLTPGANNGLGIRTPLTGDAAYVGSELQILDNDAPIYANLAPYQYHGSLYGVMPAKRGYLKPTGEWNYQEVTVKDTYIKIVLNGTTILEGDWAEASKNGTADKREHPGLKNRKGHIGFLGHGDKLKFRNIRIKELK